MHRVLPMVALDGDTPARIVIYSGQPIRELVAVGGPFVVNRRTEITQAFTDFHAGRFGPVPRQARLVHDRGTRRPDAPNTADPGRPSTMKIAETSVPVHPLLAQRWSPRGFDRTHSIEDGQLTALLEAARWAPSAGNSQPWRFLVTRRGESGFARLTSTLAPGNQLWADAASVLMLVAAETVDESGAPRQWAAYDTGQAIGHLITQAQADGLATHQMGGFDADAVRAAFRLDERVTPIVVVAIGRLDADARLPEQLAARERAPRTRLPLPALLLSADEDELTPTR